jgi:hypothetical protein
MKFFSPLWIIEHFLTLHWVGAAIGAAGSIAGGLMGGSGSDDAADAMEEAAEAAIAEQRRQWDAVNKQTKQYRVAGTSASNTLADLLGLDMPYSGPDLTAAQERFNRAKMALESGGYGGSYSGSGLRSSANNGPGYDYDQFRQEATNRGMWLPVNDAGRGDMSAFQAEYDAALRDLNAIRSKTNPRSDKFGSLLRSFSEEDLANDVVYNKGLEFGLNEGVKGLERRASAMGGYDSGSTLKALLRFGNDYGETKAAGAQQRFMADKGFTYDTLSGVANRGLSATGLNAGVGTQVSGNISDAIMSAGNARAAGIVGNTNAWSDAISGVGNAINQYRQDQSLKNVLVGGGNASSTVDNEWWRG